MDDVLAIKAARLNSDTKEDVLARQEAEMEQVRRAMSDYYEKTSDEVSVEGDGQQTEETGGEDQSEQAIIPRKTTRPRTKR